MLLSKLIGERYREKPADATIISHIYSLKGGYIRQVSNGSFTLLPPAKRVIHKIENIIRQEMDAIGGQEVLLPVVLPREIWEESGRYDSIGKELLRFRDRNGGDYVLAMTHEEAAVQLARNDARSYTKYPFMIYQIQTKFRDEPRSRGGLIRVREFSMKDAYSFHTSQEDLARYYEICLQAYHRIFRRVGLSSVVSVGSDSGMMGGLVAHEFMLLSEAGEDTIVTCSQCDYRANMEIAVGDIEKVRLESAPIEKIYTPDVTTIDALSKSLQIPPEQMVKAALFQTEEKGQVIIAFIRGDLEVNEAKLRKLVGKSFIPLADGQKGIVPGYCGPYQLESDDQIQVFYDQSLEDAENMLCGANIKEYHYRGVSFKRDIKVCQFVDIAKVKEGATCKKCGAPLTLQRGIEVGNIFQLGDKYTKSMQMTYIDQDNLEKYPIMGCYGIGIGRLFACIMENHHDDFGPIWPYAVAPWQIHICAISSKKMNVLPKAQEVYRHLCNDYEVLLDDRAVTAGVQFADADLLGIPLRVIISARNLEENLIEIVTRDKKMMRKVPEEELLSVIAEMVQTLKSADGFGESGEESPL